jgi:hypothetical protein
MELLSDLSIIPKILLILSKIPLWLNEKRTTLVYKAIIQKTKYTTKEVVQ